ncbi:carbohydrate ABC transporter permease [Microlunatus speluncae]|uniref:carbohydrate ABC transporter permease n=1 Tax=Microlunatus speluncae TaxID=2594267 RepID=UPI001C2DCD84|nr:carbohydrate ABC transporter permease [Microlunatus speluncae]
MAAGRRGMRPVRVVQYLLLIMVLVISAGPLLWVLVNAIRPDSEIIAYPPTVLPGAVTGDHFVALFTLYDFGTYLLNSLVIAGTATAGALVFGTLAAYAMARFDFRLVRVLGELSLVAYLIPPILVLVPVTQILFGSGLGDNRVALAVLYTATLLPFALWILRSYFTGVAVDIEEAAMIDRCTRFGAFLRVVLPQAVPGLISTGIFTFNAAWSEYLFASTLMTTNSKLPANAAIFLLMGNMGTESWGLLMAAALTIVAPVVILFVLAQRWLISGIGEGAVRG